MLAETCGLGVACDGQQMCLVLDGLSVEFLHSDSLPNGQGASVAVMCEKCAMCCCFVGPLL